MRILKQNTLRYQSFYKSLPEVSSSLTESCRDFTSLKQGSVFPQLNKAVNNSNDFFAFRKKLRNINSIQDAAELLCDELKKTYDFTLAELYLFDESDNTLKAQNDSSRIRLNKFIERIQSEGILDWVFESHQGQVIPDLSNKELKLGLKKYLLIPVIHNKKNKGVIIIDRRNYEVSLSSKAESDIELFTEEACFQIELIHNRNIANAAYKDLQIYQSKMLNEFKLSAIGELTTGVVQDILSPLQYLVTNIDILKKETNDQENQVYDSMLNQIKRIETVIKRLIKFSEMNNETIKVQPCDLNVLIKDYKKLIKSSLQEYGIEYILDLSDQLPQVLSHPSYVLQIFSNLFTIFLDEKMKGEGIYLQTRFINNNVVVRIVLTERFKAVIGFDDKSNVNLNIIHNLMKKHEGSFLIQTDNNIGTRITLTFPLKRKLRV